MCTKTKLFVRVDVDKLTSSIVLGTRLGEKTSPKSA